MTIKDLMSCDIPAYNQDNLKPICC